MKHCYVDVLASQAEFIYVTGAGGINNAAEPEQQICRVAQEHHKLSEWLAWLQQLKVHQHALNPKP